MKNVYLIISDIHDHYRNMPNRINYQAEIDHVRAEIINLGKKYKQEADNVFLMLLGDVFKGAYNDANSAVIINNFWFIASEFFAKIYCVLGNHETSFYSSNPFFTLVNNIESDKVKGILNRNWTPQGLRNVFNVVDLVIDGDVAFHFNHYGTMISRAIDGKVNIALYHQDLVSPEIIASMKAGYGMDIFQSRTFDFSRIDVFDGFSYNFFGHLHKVYGSFLCDLKHGKTVLCYLASLGRPNVTEVDNNFLERDIPAVIVENGKFCEVQSNKFLLMRREDCVKEEVVQVQQEVYAEIKHKKELHNYVPGGDNPIENVKNCISLSEREREIFCELMVTERDQFTTQALYRSDAVLGRFGN